MKSAVKKRKPRIVRRRIAGRRHAVVTIMGRGKGRGYMVEPCAECPFRRDRPTGEFPAEAYRISAPTAYDAAWSTFGCHMSRHTAPQTCAGFLLTAGAIHNLMVRLAQADGRLDLDQVSSAVPLYETYRAMAIANGVDADDPILKPCRDR
jgi:hypothetical protein